MKFIPGDKPFYLSLPGRDGSIVCCEDSVECYGVCVNGDGSW